VTQVRHPPSALELVSTDQAVQTFRIAFPSWLVARARKQWTRAGQVRMSVSSLCKERLVVVIAVRLVAFGSGQAMTSDAVLRWARALTLPSVLFTSGLAGHVAAGGVTPAASALVPLFVLTVLAVAAFAMAPISPARAVVLMVGGQGLLHAALQLFGGTAVTATITMCGMGSGVDAVSPPTGSHLMTHSGAAASHGFAMSLMSGGHLIMLFGHLAAAVVVGVWLAAGERAFGTVLVLAARPVVNAWRTVAAVARGCFGGEVVNCPRLLHGWSRQCAVAGLVWAAGSVSRRGPPSC
jgi:hypothetical protein